MEILTETVNIPKEQLNNIETVLKNKFGTVLRWAVVEVLPDTVKVNVSYAHISA